MIIGEHPRVFITFAKEIKYTDNMFGSLDELKNSTLYLIERNPSGDCLIMVRATNKEPYLVSVDNRDMVKGETVDIPNPTKMAQDIFERLNNNKKVNTEYCDFCDYLNITEEQQESLKRNTGRCLDHICNKLKRRIIHNGYHPHLPKLSDCPFLNE